ncbi:protein CHROMOSOME TRANSMISSION FIDELITY 7 [Ricinus communis]|nr:protein CHROMOSOME TRANSMISSION FIDELITY 7 [Ricinus communis]|eukprot:XP_015582949.1 protein CHROMOSOME TRANSMISSION FIDELITY 7 [Ricinus communis]
MQFKISSFFKPSSSSFTQSKPTISPPIPNDGDDDLIVWENTRHQFLNTYERRPPKSENGDKRIEANKGQASSVLKEPISKNMCLKQESLSSGQMINKKRSYAQLHLDLGQTDFNLKTCSICGVKYAPGEAGDEKEHKTFHKNYTCGVQFRGFRNERVLHMPGTEGGRITLVLDCDPSAQRNKVQEVIKMMEIELGGGWIFHKLCKVYLFIFSQRITGCLVAEPIKEAFKILPCSVDRRSGIATTKDSKLNSSTLQFGDIILHRETTKKARTIDSLDLLDGNHNGAIIGEEVAVPAICGIRAIWVTPSNRRKHIASQLLDAVR